MSEAVSTRPQPEPGYERGASRAVRFYAATGGASRGSSLAGRAFPGGACKRHQTGMNA